MTKNVTFTIYFFAVLKWDEFLSAQLPFQLPVQIRAQLLLELEANLLAQNVNELSRMYMKHDDREPRYIQTLFGPTA